MNGITIDMSRKIKLLGLTIDDKLTFNDHVANVCRKSIEFSQANLESCRVYLGLATGNHQNHIRGSSGAHDHIYAASAWASATNKVSIKKDNQILQDIVSLNPSLLLAGLLRSKSVVGKHVTIQAEDSSSKAIL